MVLELKRDIADIVLISLQSTIMTVSSLRRTVKRKLRSSLRRACSARRSDMAMFRAVRSGERHVSKEPKIETVNLGEKA